MDDRKYQLLSWECESEDVTVGGYYAHLGSYFFDDVGAVQSVNMGMWDIEGGSSSKSQVGGDHYTKLAIQPLELTLLNMGYEAFKGACYTKINKYMIRNKDYEVEQLDKAAHVLSMWIDAARNQNQNKRVST